MDTEVYDYQVLKLTDEFYKKYTNPPYKEIMEKKNRAYNCLLLQTHYDYFICIPFRSEINHRYAYHFKGSQRSLIHCSGLDYTKMIIVNNSAYIDDAIAIIDNDEYVELRNNISRIKNDATRFLEEYVAHISGGRQLHPKEFKRRYEYSSLQYFHKELGMDCQKISHN